MLQKGVKREIVFLTRELLYIQCTLKDLSSTPPDQLDIQHKIWASDSRELSYDIEDNIDTFLVQYNSTKLAKQHGLRKVIDKSLDWLMQPKIHLEFANAIREIRSRINSLY